MVYGSALDVTDIVNGWKYVWTDNAEINGTQAPLWNMDHHQELQERGDGAIQETTACIYRNLDSQVVRLQI